MKRTIFFAVFSVLISAFISAQQANLQPAAVVNLTKSEVITVGQLRTEVSRMEASAGRSLNVPERRQVLEVMINEKLVMQAADRDKVVVTDNEVNQYINQTRAALSQQLGHAPTDAEFAQAIKSETGLEMNVFREQFHRQLVMQKYLLTKKDALIKSVKEPTDAEIMNEYILLRANFTRPQTVRFSMIQVPYGPDAASRTKAKESADRLVREIGSNTNRFDEVAARSVTPNSGYVAGDAGYLPRNQEARNLVGNALMNTAFSLNQGQVSALIEGVQGFQIIKVTENYEQKNLELNDIYDLGSKTTVREYIKQVMFSQKQQMILNQASEELVRELRAGRNVVTVHEDRLNW